MGEIAPLSPQVRTLDTKSKSRSGTYLLDQTRRSNFKDFMAVSIVYILTT